MQKKEVSAYVAYVAPDGYAFSDVLHPGTDLVAYIRSREAIECTLCDNAYEAGKLAYSLNERNGKYNET